MAPELENTHRDPRRCSIDDIIDLYARDVDVTLLRENLKRSVDERLAQAEAMFALWQELHIPSKDPGRA